MTKETTYPAPVSEDATTVFSDGSTFDYVNGYRSNGAPVATRDRVAPTIIKSHAILTPIRIVTSLFLLFATVLLVLFPATLAAYAIQLENNTKVIEEAINGSGVVSVVESKQSSVLVAEGSQVFNCDIETVSAVGDTGPVAYVFCNDDGQPASFTVDLPYDPKNVFYSAPAKH